ncbi:hypothetical protein BESB_047260 [Besnoitia besnoiti]|uniref:Uncharacterized protein n=1 Tax=Besnoitia besnoiti TaxID=94643 RepID=A0A2A9MH91_BESBE|nr:hypothetical protein BESB_047260 [Besnoitia besnoiti]PFH36534.1 hypothetical protein BESB_047260 [Besnoitia besnoiti]
MAASTVGGVSDPGTNVPLHVMASVVAVPAVVSGPHTGATTDVQPGCGLSPQHAAASQTDYVWSWDHRPPPPEPVEESTLSGALPPAAAAILALTNPSAAVAGAAAATGARVPSIPVGSFAGSEEGTRLSNVRAMCQTIELARALVSVYYHPEQKPLVKTAFHRRADVVRVLEDIRQMRAILVDPVEKLQVQELEEALQVACMRSMEEEAHAGGEAEAAERALRKQLTDEEASEGSSSALAGAGAFVADAAAKLGGCIRQATSELLGADKKSKGVKRRLSGGLLKLAWKGIRRGRSGHRAPVKSNAAPPVATESSSQGSTSVARSTPPRSAGCCRSANAIAGVKENAQVLEAIDELSEDTGVGEMSCRARSDRRACRGRSLSLRTERAGRRGWGGRRSRTPAGLFERQGGSKKICKDDVVGTERTAKFRTLSSNGVADSPVFGSLQHDRPQARTGSQSVVSHRQHSAPPLLPPHAEVHEAAHSLSQKPRRWRGWTRRWSHSDLQMSDLMEAADSVCDSRLLITAGRPRTELALGTAAASSTGTHTALCAECGKHVRKAPRRLSRFRKLRARDEPGVNKSILSQKIRNFEPSLPSNEVCTSALDTRRKSSVTSMYSRVGSADRPRRSTWNPFRVHKRRSSGALGGQASSGREGTQKEQEGQDAHPTHVVSELEKRVTKGAAAVPRTSTVKGWLRRALSGSSKSKGWRPYEHEAEQGGETSAQLRRSFPTASDGGGSSVRTDSLPSQVSMTSQSMTADEAGGGLQGGAATMNKPGTIIDADVSSSGAEPAIELWLPRHVSRSSSRGLEEYHSSHKSERLSLACDTLDDVRRSAWHPGRNGGLESEALRSETRCRIRRGLPSRSPSESEEVDTSFSETIGAGSDPDGQQLPH